MNTVALSVGWESRSSADRRHERLFSGGVRAAAALVVAALVAVGVFLVAQSLPAILADGDQLPGAADSFTAYVWPLAFGTVWAAALALLIATPLALGVALFTTHYAPRRLAAPIGYVIDLLAAVPSVVFGLWGITVLAPAVQPVYAWLTAHVGWFPLFAPPASGTGRTVLTAAIVLAVMVLPIMTALCRELFLATPRITEEAALALGATRWEMIRMSVLPNARSGIISAVLLGLARALGETMAVAMVLSPALVVHFALLTSSNPSTIASNIALQFPEASGLGVNALLATGLVLFAITLVVNLAARLLVGRGLAGQALFARLRLPRFVRRGIDQVPVSRAAPRRAARKGKAASPAFETGRAAFNVGGSDNVLTTPISENHATEAQASETVARNSANTAKLSTSGERPRSALARRLRGRAAGITIVAAFVLVLLPLLSIIGVSIANGAARLDVDFFTQSMRGVVGAGGGALHAVIGTLEVTGMAMLLSVPLGIGAALFVTEYASRRAARAIMLAVDMMLGIPSIVAGLFAFALFSLLLADAGVRSGFIGSIALSVLMVPIVVRSSVEFLSLVPTELREASLALGVPRWRTVRKVVVPTAFGGLVTGVVLAVARVIGETAPLLLVAGYTASMNYNLFDERMMTLPVFVYNQYASQGPDPAPFLDRAWAGALTLMLIVIVLNLAARLAGRLLQRVR